MLTNITNTAQTNYNGSVHHEGFKFHRKYKGKKCCTYWCANNRSKDSLCTAKIKVNSLGKVIEVIGEHNSSCYIKQEMTQYALGYVKINEDQRSPPDMTEAMLQRAEEIALKNLSMAPKKVHLIVLKEMEQKYKIFKGATNIKIISRVKNCRTKLNGNDVYRTIEMESLSKIKNSNLFFLQFNITFPNEYDGKLERIIGFGNPSLIRVLGGNKRVFIDGTFKIVPKPFYQCLIIMVFDEQTDSFVPVFYVLLTSKTEQIYRHALYWVKASSDYKMKPDRITCDFEKALHNAIAIEFPSAVINGCLFH